MQNILQIENPSSDEELSKAAIHKAEMSLVELEARFEAVRKLGLENLAAEDGSIIANANKRSMGIYQSQLISLLQVSLETLNAIFATQNEALGITPYILNRSALESIATAIWLASFDTLEKRAFNALRLTLDNYKDSKRALQEIAGEAGEVQALHDLATALLGDAKRRFKAFEGKQASGMPQHTQIVKKADAIYRRVRGKRHLYQGLTSWQICSGVAHGGQIAIGNMPVFTVLKDDGKRYPKASTLSLMRAYPCFTLSMRRLRRMTRSVCGRSRPRRLRSFRKTRDRPILRCTRSSRKPLTNVSGLRGLFPRMRWHSSGTISTPGTANTVGWKAISLPLSTTL